MKKKIRFHILGKKGSDSFAMQERLSAALKEFVEVMPTVQEVDDENEIMMYGVSILPSLVIDGTVRVIGRVPEISEIVFFIRELIEYEQRHGRGI